MLQIIDSPASNLNSNIITGMDYTATVASVGSTVPLVASAIGFAVAPAVIGAAAVGGLAVGAYSIGRSVMSLWDRYNHDQPVDLQNSEARMIWFTAGIAC